MMATLTTLQYIRMETLKLATSLCIQRKTIDGETVIILANKLSEYVRDGKDGAEADKD